MDLGQKSNKIILVIVLETYLWFFLVGSLRMFSGEVIAITIASPLPLCGQQGFF